MSRSKIRTESKKIRLADAKMVRVEHDKKWYEKRVSELQLEMLRVQQAFHRQGLRGILVFEGQDAAGKGGSIRRLTEKLDPRGFQVHATGAPSALEQGKHYLYRFWKKIPARGSIAIFDRSWYGRVLVERVEGFADKKAWQRAYDEINEFERMLIDDGVRIVKVFLHISAEEQLRRFEERLQNPYKRWKLTTDDFRNRAKWDRYAEAAEDMFDKTSTTLASWHLIGGNHKWHARTRVLELATAELGKGVDLSVPIADPAVVDMAREYGLSMDGVEQASSKKKSKSEKSEKAGKSKKKSKSEKAGKSKKRSKADKTEKSKKKGKRGKNGRPAETGDGAAAMPVGEVHEGEGEILSPASES